MKIISVVGARPNFMKVAPIHKAFKKVSNLDSNILHLICHTGQHYDEKMSKVFFDDLELPKPDFYLGVGSGSHAEQTANVMIQFEKILIDEKPDMVLVVGDVNSTIACSLTAKKLHIKVVHVEAGLRSFDMEMPEEINRVLTDRISDFLFVTEESGLINLKNEGVPEDKIFFVGNVMIDSLIHYQPKVDASNILHDLNLPSSVRASARLAKTKSRQEASREQNAEISINSPVRVSTRLAETQSNEEVNQSSVRVSARLAKTKSRQEAHRELNTGISNTSSVRVSARLAETQSKQEAHRELNTEISKKGYVLVTLHRPSNVDTKESLEKLVNFLNRLGKERKVVFPIHPRTKSNLEKFELLKNLNQSVIITDPIGYIDFQALIKNAELIVTDSGGIQEESTYLGVQCITLRTSTERPITVDIGTNQLIGIDLSKAEAACLNVLKGNKKIGKIPPLWDGESSNRIVDILVKQFLDFNN